MINTWYYTLSTIAQTLASILALGAVFSVLRLDQLAKNIADYKDRAKNILDIKRKHIPGYALPGNTRKIIQDLTEFRTNYEMTYRANVGINEDILNLVQSYGILLRIRGDLGFIEDTRKYLERFVEQRDELVNSIRLPSIVTAITIGISIIVLSVPELQEHLTFLWFIVGLTILSGFLVNKSAWDAIKRLD